MANEITTNVSINVINGDYLPGPISISKQISQSVLNAASGIQIIPTTGEPLDAGELVTYGCLFLRNLDSANFVTYGSTLYEFKLKAGEWAWLRVTPAAAVSIKADTGSVKVFKHWLND